MDQLGVLTVGTLVPKEGRHTLPFITLLAFVPWSRNPPLLDASPKVVALGHVPCSRWSTRHSLILETTSRGVKSKTKAGAQLHKQRMCQVFAGPRPISGGLVHSPKMEL